MRDIRPAPFVVGCSMLAKTSRQCNKNIRKSFRSVWLGAVRKIDVSRVTQAQFDSGR
jgi:hypothetical protein